MTAPSAPAVPPLPSLRALGEADDAAVFLASVPLPRGADARLAVDGVVSQALPLAYWPGADGPGEVKQVLLLGIGGAAAAETLSLNAGHGHLLQPEAGPPTEPGTAWTGPLPQLTVVQQKKTGFLMREVNELVLCRGAREIGLRLGLQTAGAWRWWQFVRLEQLWAGPVCRAYRAAGYIAVTEVDDAFFLEAMKANNGYWLHRHNWLLGELYLQVFANGLVRVTARHLNNRLVDKGSALTDVLPVLSLRTDDGPRTLDLALDGTLRDVDLGGAHLDLARCQDLHGPEHPGRLWHDAAADLTILQPYTGPEMDFGDYEPEAEYKLHAQERRMWAGMARSFSFDLSLAAAPIRTRRFLPPLGWQAHCGMLWPDGALPVRGPMEPWIATFKDLAREHYHGLLSHRFLQKSAFWDGEHAYALMLHAYRDQNPVYYRAAYHHAQAWADIGIDHTDFSIRIWYQRLGSTGPVLNRTLGLLAVYLEEGDPYMLRVAESVADAADALDRGNWPRRGYGRDGAYIRSLTRLYDVTGDSHYLRRARAACHRAIQCQRPDGSYGDQGNAAEAHGHSCEIIKPWMSAILNEVLVDYLERAPDDAAVAAAVMRNADWLLRVQVTDDPDGAYWPYEVAWGENSAPPWAAMKGEAVERHPIGEAQLDYLARVLLWASRHSGDPRYARAWTATYRRRYLVRKLANSSYGVVKVPENFTWHESHLWNARWTPDGLVTAPVAALIEPDRIAEVELPDGSRQSLTPP